MFGRIHIIPLTFVLASWRAVAAFGQEAPLEFYINRGSVTNVQVNARNFVNEGRFFVSTGTSPWDSQNTINFTNRGTMIGAMGFRLEHVPPGFGFRSMASNVFNAPGASIVALDSGGFLPFVSGQFISTLFEPDASYVTINALNVTNRGDISVGANGLMQLFAGRMDLSGGSLIVENVGSGGFGLFVDVTATNFFPAPGVYDLGWGIDTTTNMGVGGIVVSVSPNIINTPTFRITNFFSGTLAGSCEISLTVSNAQVWVRDQRLSLTNRVIQVVAVDALDTNISVYASFYPLVFPSGSPQDPYLSTMVEFRSMATNFRTLDLETNSFYVFDQLGSHTNFNLLANVVEPTFRPAPIILFRSSPGLGEFGVPADYRVLFPDIFDSPFLSNRVVTNQYAVYSAQIESLARRAPSLPDLGVTNLPGRVEIQANELKLNNTRMRGEGLISLHSSNLVGGLNTVLDSPRLNMNLSTRSNTLELLDMTPDRVERFGGFLQVFSSTWTNLYSEISGTNTNNVEVAFQLLAVRGAELHTREPVVVYDLRLTSTNGGAGNLVYADNFTVTNSLQIAANHLTFAPDSRLYLAKGIGFAYTNLLNVSTFTNFGFLQMNEFANLRRGESAPYARFVNRGTLIAFGTDVTADYFENTGSIISSNYYTSGFGFRDTLFDTDCFGRPFTFLVSEATEGAISINAGTAKIDAGLFNTLGDIRFTGGIYKFNNHQALSGGRLVFDVREILTDTGERAGNRWVATNGFNMSGVRPSGDLLGTTIESRANRLAFVEHYWSAEDRDATIEGFVNNTALGRLRLNGETFSVYQFLPGREKSALYVDVLEVAGFQASSLREFTNRVQLQMNVYFGDVESTNASINAERINRILGPNAPYNFIWVTNWAGPNSGIDVPLTENGPVRRFNRALRESVNFDSDGDGLPNRHDPFPFPPEAFGITGITLRTTEKAVTFGVSTLKEGRYIIEYSTNLAAPNWQPLSWQSSGEGGIISFTDQIRAGNPQRYYRVRQAPE